MLEDLANCDFWRGLLIGIVRPGSRQRGVDIELPGRGELPNSDAGEELVDRAEVEGGFEIVGPAGFPVSHPESALELRNSALGDEYDPRELIELGEAVERGLPHLGVQRRGQDGR